LALHLSRNARHAEALIVYKEAAQMHRELVEKNPDCAKYLDLLSDTLHNLADSHAAVGEREEAVTVAEEAVKMVRVLVKSDYSALRSLAPYLDTLSAHLGDAGRAAESLIIAMEADSLALAQPRLVLPSFSGLSLICS
jgi:tetratricopeptide (TPR) repeat protein